MTDSENYLHLTEAEVADVNTFCNAVGRAMADALGNVRPDVRGIFVVIAASEVCHLATEMAATVNCPAGEFLTGVLALSKDEGWAEHTTHARRVLDTMKQMGIPITRDTQIAALKASRQQRSVEGHMSTAPATDDEAEDTAFDALTDEDGETAEDSAGPYQDGQPAPVDKRQLN